VRVLYDGLRRPTHTYVDGGALSAEILRQFIVYGEGVTDAEDFNLRGQPYLVFDGAGLVVHESFDFKGNLAERRRRLAVAYQTEPDWIDLDEETDPDTIEGTASSFLEDDSFTDVVARDALNRPTSLTTPDDSEQRPSYDAGDLLAKVEVRLRDAGSWTTLRRSSSRSPTTRRDAARR
jgi:YD repeat-containing protein